MVEGLAVNAANSAQVLAEIDLVVVGDDRDRAGPRIRRELNRHGAKAACTAPDEHDVAFANSMRLPAEEHAVGSRTYEGRCGRCFPGQMLGLGHALMGLDFGELSERPPGRLVAPDPEARAIHRVLAGEHFGRVYVPTAAVHHHFVPDLDVRNVGAGLPDDAGGIRTAN